MSEYKATPLSPDLFRTIVQWVHIAVGMAMDYCNEPTSNATRELYVEDVLGRWRGNRPISWRPTGQDVDALFETTLRWCVEHTGVELSLPPFPAP